MRQIKHVIDDIVLLGYKEMPGKGDTLAPLLAEFVHLCLVQELLSEDIRYQEPPESPVAEIQRIVKRNFPDFGRYEAFPLDGIAQGTEKRDAAEDLTSFISELAGMKWYFEKTSRRNGVQHLRDSFQNGLGLRALNLLSYMLKSSAR